MFYHILQLKSKKIEQGGVDKISFFFGMILEELYILDNAKNATEGVFAK
jgi:hypothetical protein